MAEGEKKEKKEKEKFVVTEIATQTAPIIKDTSAEDKYFNELTALCEILNKLEKIERGM